MFLYTERVKLVSYIYIRMVQNNDISCFCKNSVQCFQSVSLSIILNGLDMARYLENAIVISNNNKY